MKKILLYTLFSLIVFPMIAFSKDYAKNLNKARIETNYGTIVVELEPEKAPITVANFKRYVREGYYNGTIFHRVIKGFMIQGGGYTQQMEQRELHTPIINEADNGLKNKKYTIAMARTSYPDSATSQFFINTADNASLDFKEKTSQGWGYAVFGKVIQGFDVVDAIEKVRTGSKSGHNDVPMKEVLIKSIVLEK